MLGVTFRGMALLDEKRNFSKRLLEALRKARLDASSPTRIAREFNLRYHGSPVTAQSVRKWLTAKSIPSQDKIRVLADWLNVSAQWLRFGESDTGAMQRGRALNQEAAYYVVEDEALSRNFGRLSEHHKKIVLEIVRALLAAESGRR